jgi:hypothetical protein
MADSPSNPIPQIARLAMKSSDMLISSLEVINHRTQQMLAAAGKPAASDMQEMALMSQEKIEAASESGQAVMGQIYAFNQGLYAAMFQLALLISSDMLSLATSQTPAQAIARQTKLTQSLINGAFKGMKLANAGASMAEDGLTPIHRRVTANAKRLSDVVKAKSAKTMNAAIKTAEAL